MSPDSPFAPVHSRPSFVETAGGGDILRRLDDGLGAREPFLLVTGESGVGKTALAHEAVARWGARVRAAFLAYPAQTAVELLEEVIRRFGAEPPDGASRPRLFACLERVLEENAAQGQVAMIVVDDAHDLPAELLEELRLLVNAAQKVGRPMEVLLLGFPALETRLEAGAFAALKQRVSVRARLDPLAPGETKKYLHHRMLAAGADGPGTFTRKTCREIAALTGGVPRQINALATEAMRRAREAGENAIGPERVHIAAVALWGIDVPPLRDEDDEESRPAARPPAPRPTTPAPAPKAVTPPPPAPRPQPAAKVEPVVVKPEPVVAKAEPVVAKQEPVAVKPEPVVARPKAEPVVAKPEPVVAKPEPVASPKVETPVAAASPTPPRVLTIPARPVIIDDDYAPPSPPPPATHDKSEWVKRFVGDRGPLQIGSRSVEEPWIAEAAREEIARATGAPMPEPLPSELAPTDPPGPIDRRSRPRKPKAAAAAAAASPKPAFRLPAAAALVALVAIVAVTLVIRAGNHANKPAPETAVTAISATKMADDTKPAAKNATASTRSRDDEPSPRTENTQGPFTIDVGGYSDLQTAIDERDRMQLLTGFEGWVIPADDGQKHRVVVGAYRNRSRAQNAANMLLRSRTLPRAVVMPLPPRDQRL